MKTNIISISVLSLIFYSCNENNVLYFDAPASVDFLYSGQNMVKYSFLNNPADYYDYVLKLKVTGNVSDVDREVGVAVVPDSTTVTNDDYEIIESVVKANNYDGHIILRLFNNERLKTETFRLWLKLDGSKDFIKGNIEYNQFEILWENRMSEPANWRYYKFGLYSTTVHKFMISVLGVSYLEYGLPDNPSVPNLSQLEILSYQAQMRDELRKYNIAHPTEPLIHEDGVSKGENVVIP